MIEAVIFEVLFFCLEIFTVLLKMDETRFFSVDRLLSSPLIDRKWKQGFLI